MVDELLEEECYATARGRDEDFDATTSGLSSPVLLTERLLLRQPHSEDVDAIAYLAHDRRVTDMLSRMPYPYTRNDAVDFVKRVRKGEMGNCIYAITEAETGIFMGCCGIHPHKHGAGLEIGYWLGAPYWGQGFATEAAQAVIDLVFRATELDVLNISCRTTNEASRQVIHKCGFRFSALDMADSLCAGKVAVERFVLDRSTWIGLKSRHIQ